MVFWGVEFVADQPVVEWQEVMVEEGGQRIGRLAGLGD